ncbi:hypothetical protein SXCC_02462 [Gluconacetobacter sp. SXCC-1]|nr:hypothetical protein SXCC_02462 [Gluconacetobacter sp. SXCC-1]
MKFPFHKSYPLRTDSKKPMVMEFGVNFLLFSCLLIFTEN